MEKVAIKVYLLLSFFCFCTSTFAQDINNIPPLERKITLELKGESFKETLKVMEEKGSYTFAYKTDIIHSDNQINRIYLDKSTREILDDLFQGTLSYKGRGNYIILRKAPKLKAQEISLSGYVVDAKNGEKIPFATVYEPSSLTSTTSDEYGYYALKLLKRDSVVLNIRKEGYKDTLYQWNATGSEVFNVNMESIVVETNSKNDTVDLISKLQLHKIIKLSDEQKATIKNFKERLKQKIQLSIVPPIGTNGNLSTATVVDYSLSLFGGVNGGVKKVEIAGLFNIDLDTVQFFQAAGLFNVVGGPQKGVQLSGLSNINISTFKGLQVGGLFNWVGDDVEGLQLAGFSNFTNGKQKGTQIAGFNNFIKDSSAVVQLAGFTNYIGKSSQGTQAAGFLNVANKNYEGAQLAGFLNYAADGFKGTQVSGFLNIANRMKGVQLGFVNISDSIKGVPIGFFSFSKQGYHQLELSTNEMMQIQLAFKTGTHQFYNSFIGNLKVDQNSIPVWGAGYGIGSSVKLSSKNYIFFDLQAISHVKGNDYRFNILNKFSLSYHFQVAKKFALAIGPSFNLYFVEKSLDNIGAELSTLSPYTLYNETLNNGTNVQFWVGGNIAIKIF